MVIEHSSCTCRGESIDTEQRALVVMSDRLTVDVITRTGQSGLLSYYTEILLFGTDCSVL